MYEIHAPFSANKERIYRRLNIVNGTNPYDYAERVYDHLFHVATTKMELTNCYCVVDNAFILGEEELDTCEKMVICFSSCSEIIVDTIRDMLDNGDFIEGYILNDMANEIVFNASACMNDRIKEHLNALGYHLTKMYSPGENNLDMHFQKVFMDVLLSEKNMAVSLTENYMISPEKSMLYVYGADPNIPDIEITHDCKKCSNLDCFFRMD